MKIEFDKAFENEILAEALGNQDYVKQAVRICDAHHFATPQHSWIWDQIQNTWRKYREVPTTRMLLHRAKDEFKDPAKLRAQVSLIHEIKSSKPKSPKLALEELNKFVQFVTAQLALEEAATSLERGDVESTYRSMTDALRRSTLAVERKYTLIDFVEGFEERQERRKYEKEHPDEVVAIPTSWETLDEITGGIRIGELALLMATTGRGKSIGLTNISFAAATRGFETLYVGFEMPARQLATRADSRWLEVDYKRMKNYDLLPSELRTIKTKFSRSEKRLRGKLKIASFPIQSATISDVEALLEDLESESSWRPKLICLDSADHLKSSRSRESFRLQQSDVYWEVKRLAEESGYAIWSSTHVGREWAKERATAEAAGESYDKARIADLVATLNDPDAKSKSDKAEVVDEDEEDDDDADAFTKPTSSTKRMELLLAKYRDGASNRLIPMEAKYEKMVLEEAKAEA